MIGYLVFGTLMVPVLAASVLMFVLAYAMYKQVQK